MPSLAQAAEGQASTRLWWDNLGPFLAAQPYVSPQSCAGIFPQSCGCTLGPQNSHWSHWEGGFLQVCPCSSIRVESDG